MAKVLSEEAVERLLNDLCVSKGFCLPPDGKERLRENPPTDPKAFTDAVFLAEGLDPELADLHLWRSVRNQVAEAFSKLD